MACNYITMKCDTTSTTTITRPRTILDEGVSTRVNSMLEDDGSTQTQQPNTLQLDELLTSDADDELFGASDYLPVSFQI